MPPRKKVARVEKGPKDDGSRWIVMREGVPVYRGKGIRLSDARRLADGLVDAADLVCVSEKDAA